MKWNNIDINELIDKNPSIYSQDYLDQFLNQTAKIGLYTKEIANQTVLNYKYQAESAIASILRIASYFSDSRMEAACKRVIFYGFHSMRMVKTVLMEKLDKLPLNHDTDIYGGRWLF